MSKIEQMNRKLEHETFKRKYTHEITPEWKMLVKKAWGKHHGLFEVWIIMDGQNWLVNIHFDNPDIAYSNGKLFLERRFSEIALSKKRRTA